MYFFFLKENNVFLWYDWKRSIFVDWLVYIYCIFKYMYFGKEKLLSLYSRSIIYLYMFYIFDLVEKKNENNVYLKKLYFLIF